MTARYPDVPGVGGPVGLAPEAARLAAVTAHRRLDWFATADVLGEYLIPARGDWCCVHVRASVIAALRGAQDRPLHDLGLASPVDGERLDVVALRHRDGAREAQIRAWLAQASVHVGDPYGAGRVTATGRTRYSPHVQPAAIRAAGITGAQAADLARFAIASSVVAPLRTPDGAVIGALTLIREHGSEPGLGEPDVLAAEQFAVLAAEALDGSRLVTIHLPRLEAGGHRGVVWRPDEPTDPGNAARGRTWARRILPELLIRAPRTTLYDDMDLLLTEMITNAVVHGGGLQQTQVSNTGGHLRLATADQDPRTPILRPHRGSRETNGRGMHFIDTIADQWGVQRHYSTDGKTVWADLNLET